MMRLFLVCGWLLAVLPLAAQVPTPEALGYRHLRLTYKGDPVDVLVQAKKGEEQKAKPLFLFCQGSLPKPLLIADEGGPYPVLPFRADSLLAEYHVVIIGKPYVPLAADAKTLAPGMIYHDPQTGQMPAAYVVRNYLDYYVGRNAEVIRWLQRQPYVAARKLVVAGHSEGATVAAKLALKSRRVTHLIYASGCPMGRVMVMVQQNRAAEADTAHYADEVFADWHATVANRTSLAVGAGDTPKTTYDFSVPPIEYLRKLKIPVLVSYGTKDWGAPFNDYLQVETIRNGQTNFTFQAHRGLDHNFFPLKPDGSPDYDTYNWPAVGLEWLRWARKS